MSYDYSATITIDFLEKKDEISSTHINGVENYCCSRILDFLAKKDYTFESLFHDNGSIYISGICESLYSIDLENISEELDSNIVIILKEKFDGIEDNEPKITYFHDGENAKPKMIVQTPANVFLNLKYYE